MSRPRASWGRSAGVDSAGVHTGGLHAAGVHAARVHTAGVHTAGAHTGRARDELDTKPAQWDPGFAGIVGLEGGGWSRPHPLGGGVAYCGTAHAARRRR